MEVNTDRDGEGDDEVNLTVDFSKIYNSGRNMNISIGKSNLVLQTTYIETLSLVAHGGYLRTDCIMRKCTVPFSN